jgi:hypothetical protein
MSEISVRGRVVRWLEDRPDDAVLRWVFGGLLMATIGVVALDYRDLATRASHKPRASVTASPTVTAEPLPLRRGKEGAPVPKGDARLRAPMAFDLMADGRLMAVGTIEPGTARIFADEIAKRGSYVKTVVLHSPGGSVSDAIEMGRLIREKKFATGVEDGSYCASSCPLVFAGGVERKAGAKAAIGVHQVFVAAERPLTGEESVDNAQRISARCQKYLRDMGVDAQVWFHAMETPKDELYYFKPGELITLKLATQPAEQGREATVGRGRS